MYSVRDLKAQNDGHSLTASPGIPSPHLPTLSHQSRNISSPLGSQQPGTYYEKLLASTDLEPLETAT